MKNLFRLSVLVMLALIFAVSTSFAQKSKAYSGDKGSREINKSQDIFKSLVADFKEQKNALEKSRDKMLKNPSYYRFQIVKTDSIIDLYQQKIMMLEDQMITFAVTAAGKDQLSKVELKSRNVTALADAYLTVKYADNMNSVANGNSLSVDSARIENNWYNPVYVTVKGPAGFHTSFTLGSKKHVVLPISIPGGYTVFYTYGNTTKCVGKVFDVRNTDFDSKTGRRYAFLSELPAR